RARTDLFHAVAVDIERSCAIAAVGGEVVKLGPDPGERDPEPGKPDPDPGKIEAELAKWNWGAFLLGPIWGIGNGVFRSLLTLVPFYGIYEWIMLGRHGNSWAWDKREWRDIESFHTTQRKWAMWGIVVDVLFVAFIVYPEITQP